MNVIRKRKELVEVLHVGNFIEVRSYDKSSMHNIHVILQCILVCEELISSVV